MSVQEQARATRQARREAAQRRIDALNLQIVHLVQLHEQKLAEIQRIHDEAVGKEEHEFQLKSDAASDKRDHAIHKANEVLEAALKKVQEGVDKADEALAAKLKDAADKFAEKTRDADDKLDAALAKVGEETRQANAAAADKDRESLHKRGQAQGSVRSGEATKLAEFSEKQEDLNRKGTGSLTADQSSELAKERAQLATERGFYQAGLDERERDVLRAYTSELQATARELADALAKLALESERAQLTHATAVERARGESRKAVDTAVRAHDQQLEKLKLQAGVAEGRAGAAVQKAIDDYVKELRHIQEEHTNKLAAINRKYQEDVNREDHEYNDKLERIREEIRKAQRERDADTTPYNETVNTPGELPQGYQTTKDANEPPGRARAVAERHSTALHRWIKKEVGPLPWVEDLRDCTVVSVNESTHRCVVDTTAHGSVVTVRVNDVQYGLRKPKVGNRYTLHVPDAWKCLHDQVDPGRPWIKVRGGQKIYWTPSSFYARSCPVYVADWPLPTVDPLNPAAHIDVGETLAATLAIPRVSTQFIGVDGLGTLWAGGAFELPGTDTPVWQGVIKGYPDGGSGVAYPLFILPPNTAPVAVDATPGFSKVLSVSQELWAVEPRTFTDIVLNYISVWFGGCEGTTPFGDDICGTYTASLGAGLCPPCTEHTICFPWCFTVCNYDGPGHNLTLIDHDVPQAPITGTFLPVMPKTIRVMSGPITQGNNVASAVVARPSDIPITGPWIYRTFNLQGGEQSSGGYIGWEFLPYIGDDAICAAYSESRRTGIATHYPLWTTWTITAAASAEQYYERLNPSGWAWAWPEMYANFAYRIWTPVGSEDSTAGDNDTRTRVGVEYFPDPQGRGGPHRNVTLADHVRAFGSERTNGYDNRDFLNETHRPLALKREDGGYDISQDLGFVQQCWGTFPRAGGEEVVIAAFIPSHADADLDEDHGHSNLKTYIKDRNGWREMLVHGNKVARLVAASRDAMSMVVETAGVYDGPGTVQNTGPFYQTIDGGETWDRVQLPHGAAPSYGYIVDE